MVFGVLAVLFRAFFKVVLPFRSMASASSSLIRMVCRPVEPLGSSPASLILGFVK